MDTKQLALLVTAVTVVLNIVFALSGVTASVSCTVAQGVASAYASVTNSMVP